MSLKDQLISDLDVFMNASEFGSSAVYNGSNIVVDFRSKSDVIFEGRGDGIHEASGEIPSCYAKQADVEFAEVGDTIIIDNETYYIIDLDPPSGGMIKLYLSKDRP